MNSMRNPASLTVEGAVVFAIAFLFERFGVPYVEEEVGAFVSVAIGILSIVMVLVGRHRLGGINWFGLRKAIK